MKKSHPSEVSGSAEGPIERIHDGDSKRAVRRDWAILLLLVSAFFAYFPSLNGLPLWDDLSLTENNPLIKSPIFALEVFRNWLFPDVLSVYYRPVQALSYLFDYAVWRGNPLGYHLTNIVIHGTAGVLLFFCLERIFRLMGRQQPGLDPWSGWIALAISAIWVVHPVHNAAVAYISGRADSLAALFALGAWLLFLATFENQRRKVQISGACGALFLGLLALCSKEIAITWLALFVVVHFWFIPTGISRWKLLGALAMMLGCYLLLRHLPEARTAEAKMVASPLSARPLLMLRALGDYTRLIFWPDNLHMCRSVAPELVYPQLLRWYKTGGFDFLSLFGIATLVAFVWGAFSQGRGRSLRRLGILWFVIGFIPISNLFSLNAQVAEHWIYMPSIGFLLFLAGWAIEAPGLWLRRGGVFLAVAVVALGTRTAFRSDDWTNPELFFAKTLRDGGYDARVFLHRALLRSERGDSLKGEQEVKMILKDDPSNSMLLLGLASIYLSQERDAEMELLLKRIDPARFAEFASANLNLSRLEAKRGNLDAAIAYLDRSLLGTPPAKGLIPNKAILLNSLGREEEAVAMLENFIQTRRWDLRSRLVFAEIYRKNGEPDRALAILEECTSMDIWATDPMQVAAKIELARNNPRAALKWVERGLKRKPSERLYELAGRVFQQLGSTDAAANAFRLAKEEQAKKHGLLLQN